MAIKDYRDLRRRLNGLIAQLRDEAPATMAGYRQMHAGAVADGALAPKVKELIALGIGIAVRCDGCIAYHVHDAMRAGATREEVVEAIAVAVMMGGGPAVVYGAEALEALDQFSKRPAKPVAA